MAKTTHGGRRQGAGRRPKPLTERKLQRGKVWIGIDVETAALAQRLMLHFPDVPNVESLFAYALRRLAETIEYTVEIDSENPF